MADPVVWAPMRNANLPDWQPWDAFVPKVWQGAHEWTKDGPSPARARLDVGRLGFVYEWRGPRLVCVNCLNAER